MSENAAADVDANPGVRPGETCLQRGEKRVTARIVRTEGGEVIPEYNIGGGGYKPLEGRARRECGGR